MLPYQNAQAFDDFYEVKNLNTLFLNSISDRVSKISKTTLEQTVILEKEYTIKTDMILPPVM